MNVAADVSATPLPRRLAPVVGLMALSPICAEYLSGYHGQRIQDLPGLLAGLLLFGPLYGAVAVLIRDLARRTGRGWPTILLLSAAAGLVQAGLIDQSLFDHESFADGPYWRVLPTRIPGVDVDASQLLVFVGGHTIWSFAAPIALVERCAPRLADRPWLGRAGLAAMVVLYLAAAALFFHEMVVVPQFHAAPAQLIGTVVVAAALTVAAFAIPRRSAPRPGRVPPAWLVGGVTLLLLATHTTAREPAPGGWAWPSIALAALLLALLGVLLRFWSGQAGWTRAHGLAVAGAPPLLSAAAAFAVGPVGNADYVGKYASNIVFLAGVIALLAWAWHRTRRAATTTQPQRQRR